MLSIITLVPGIVLLLTNSTYLAHGAGAILLLAMYRRFKGRPTLSARIKQAVEGFSKNDPDTMRRLVSSHGYSIYEEDIQTLWHSSLIRFGVRKTGAGQKP